MAAKLEQARNRLQTEGVFLGGPPHLFELAGRRLLITLLNEGLNPDSKVLDVGCGCLRGGYWLIHFLDANCYFGIEPNRDMLAAGINTLLEPGLMDSKKPKFDNNASFDFSVFSERFDFFVARSIWTHASKDQIGIMLDGFARYSKPGGAFITSYVEPSLSRLIRRRPRALDYKGEEWVGRSHESNESGIVRHRLSWIRWECRRRDLSVEEIKGKAYNFGGQRWLRIKSLTNGL